MLEGPVLPTDWGADSGAYVLLVRDVATVLLRVL